MNKKTFRRGVITAIWLAALYGAYLLLKHSGFWAQHRWVVVAFCVASGIVCFTRHWREEGDIIVSAVFLVLGGPPFFLLRDGDSADVLQAPLFIGIGLKEAYLFVQAGRRGIPTEDSRNPQPSPNHG